MSPRFWLGLPMDYDLDVAEDEIGDRLSQEVVVLANQLKPLAYQGESVEGLWGVGRRGVGAGDR